MTAALGTIIGAVSAVATTSLLLLPNLGASTENRAEIRRLAIESDVTLDEYFKHRSVARSLAELRKALPKQTGLLMDREQSRLQTHGTVIHFEVELKGLRGVEIRPRWSLFDGDTGKRLASSDEVRDPLPLALKIEKKDADTGTWEMWVDTSGLTATNFMVRLELYDERNGARVTFKDSEKFRAPPA